MTGTELTQTDVNDSATSGSIDTGLTQQRSGFDLENARRDLIALRVKHGANTPIGHRASNAIEQLQNGHLAGLQKSVAELAELTK